MREMGNEYKIFVGEPKCSRLLGIYNYNWKNKIKIKIRTYGMIHRLCDPVGVSGYRS
jgi:hypothetical protein